jgi:hypothetical protein
MHISRRGTPGVAAITSSRKLFLGIAAGSRPASAVRSVTVVNVHLPMAALLRNKHKMAYPYAKKAMEQAIISIKCHTQAPFTIGHNLQTHYLKTSHPEQIVNL